MLSLHLTERSSRYCVENAFHYVFGLKFQLSGAGLTFGLTFVLMWQSKVIDNINFRNFLELVPEVRELIHDFYAR